MRGKLNDGQLDESNLTFSDLDRIRKAFITVLTGVFHERIEYPDVKLPPRRPTAPEQTNDAAFTAPDGRQEERLPVATAEKQ